MNKIKIKGQLNKLKSMEKKMDDIVETLRWDVGKISALDAINDPVYMETIQFISAWRKWKSILSQDENNNSGRNAKEADSYSQRSESSYNAKFEKGEYTSSVFFSSDMDPEKAKQRYHTLLKKYHPDNGGSQDMTMRVMEEYKKYCEVNSIA